VNLGNLNPKRIIVWEVGLAIATGWEEKLKPTWHEPPTPHNLDEGVGGLPRERGRGPKP